MRSLCQARNTLGQHTFGIILAVPDTADHDLPGTQAVGGVHGPQSDLAENIRRLHYLGDRKSQRIIITGNDEIYLKFKPLKLSFTLND